MEQSTRQATRHWTLAQPTVSAFIASVIRDFHDRDDILQETALAVLESFDSYDPQFPFVPWAIGIAHNQIGLYLRRRKRTQHTFQKSTIACLESAFAEVDHSPQLGYLQDCIKQLEGRARILCDLRYRENLKPKAISEKIGLAANTVAKALQRMREQLRKCIDMKASAEGTSS